MQKNRYNNRRRWLRRLSKRFKENNCNRVKAYISDWLRGDVG